MSPVMVWSLPDELFYSSIIRDFMRSGMSVENYNKKIFLSRKSKANPLYTVQLGRLANLYKKDVDEVFLSGTILPYFMIFGNHEYRVKIYDSFSESRNVKRLLNLTNFINNEEDCLKFCSYCYQEDRVDFGVPYWHRSHQYPGMVACGKHECLLISTRVDQDQRGLHFSLPRPGVNGADASIDEVNISRVVDYLISRFVEGDGLNVNRCLREMLFKSGYLSLSGSTRRKVLLRDLLAFSGGFPNVSSGLLPSSEIDYKYVSGIVSPALPQHPFKKFFLLYFLLGDVEKLKESLSTLVEGSVVSSGYSCEDGGLERSPLPDKVYAHNQALMRKHQSRIINAIKSNPSAKRQDIRGACCAAYYYLYNNDRKWFEENMPRKIKARCNGKVDWGERDLELSVVVEGYLSGARRLVSLNELDKAVSGRRWLTRYRHRMPICFSLYLEWLVNVSA